MQGVGGSTGLSNSFEQYRTAGATARAMLIAAAARQWGVKPADVSVKDGVLSAGGKSATFGEMAIAAAGESVPDKPALKDPKDFKYIGKAFPRVDSPSKVDGTAKFTIDHQMDGMLIATIARPPLFGAKVKSFDGSDAEKIKGVVKVLQVPPHGVAVLAENTWAALKAQRALKVDWDEGAAEKRGSADLIASTRRCSTSLARSRKERGDARGGVCVGGEGHRSGLRVSLPRACAARAHGLRHPLRRLVRRHLDGIATADADHATACKVLGLKPEAVNLHTVWAGGSFGRRAIADSHYVAEACAIAKATASRFRSRSCGRARTTSRAAGTGRCTCIGSRPGLDADGKIVAWSHRIVGQSITAGTPFESMMVKDGVDGTSVEGAATLPYAIPNFRVDLHTMKAGVPVLWWRSVGSTHTAHATEHMIDILAREAGKDPVAFRLDMLSEHPRHAGALKLAAEKAGWGSPPPEGVHRGVAVHESFSSYVANVADVRVNDDGSVKVERVVCAIDCGLAVNPDVVAAQMEGGIGFGLGAGLKGAITLKDGHVEQTNYDGYDVLRISEMPKVEVYIVPSAAPPTGVGEPGTPVVTPAVANALLAGVGVRTTVLPMNRHKYKGQS